jgi:hypothetical protein
MGKTKAEQDVVTYVYRGGGWCNTPASARLTYRLWFDPLFGRDNRGVRLVRRRSALERLIEPDAVEPFVQKGEVTDEV